MERTTESPIIMPGSQVFSTTMGAMHNMVESNIMSGTSLNSFASYPGGFMMKLDSVIQSLKASGEAGTLLMLSIDNLAMMVSGHGFEASEKILMDIQATIKTQLSDNDYIERIQRDQFGIIIAQGDEAHARAFSQRCSEALDNYSFSSSEISLHVMNSFISVALPAEGKSAQEAMDQAYIGLHDTAAGNSFNPYHMDNELAMSARQQMGLANHLNTAIKEDRLRMAYQPVICSKTGGVSHYEALLRLFSKEGQISSAGALIPIAETMGMIDIIDMRTLGMVIEELRNSTGIILAFNVSNMTIRNEEWMAEFKRLLAETPDIAERLVVEITETAIENDVGKVQHFIETIQSYGAKVALDDFGSGYTSFRQLKQLSIDMVKIDGSFIKDLVENTDNQLFVRTLLDFSNSFGLTSVAEFVENGEIAKMLMELGVEYMQGYYFGRPENHRSWLDGGEYSAS